MELFVVYRCSDFVFALQIVAEKFGEEMVNDMPTLLLELEQFFKEDQLLYGLYIFRGVYRTVYCT